MARKKLLVSYLPLITLSVLCLLILGPSNVDSLGINKAEGTQATTYGITVVTDTSTNKIEKTFLSVDIDTNTVITLWDNFNFSSTKMQNVAKALAPSDLRVGGIMADFLVFQPEGKNNQQAMKAPPNFDLEDDDDDNVAGKQVQNFDNYPITGEMWDQLTTFLKTVGWNFIFDFNLFIRKNNLWDPSNAELLLNYSASKGIPFSGFQLGNEPGHYARLFNMFITPSILSADFKALRNLISRYPMYKNCSLFGPDTTDSASSMIYLQQFVDAVGADVLNEIDIHHYYMDCKKATSQLFMNTTVLNSLKTVLNSAINATSKRLPIRLTETSSCYGGGAQNLTNVYVNGFIWLDKLGIAAQSGLSRVFRQTFIGGRYELVSAPTFDPNPDFYLSVLFKRLVMGAVFPVKVTPSNENLRVYANCARQDFYSYPKGSIVIYFLNLADEAAALSLGQFPKQNSEVFLLTPGDNRGILSSYVKLNGELLMMSGDEVPQMFAKHYNGDIRVEAQSFGFIVIPQANVPACSQGVSAKTTN